MLKPAVPGIAEEIANCHRLLQMGRVADAEAAARALQARHPARGDANEALALVLVNIGKPGDALRFAEAAVRAEPRNAGYLINLGRLYLDFELIEEALPMIEKAFRIDPKLYQAPWAMGEFFHKAGKGLEAVRYLKQALAAAPPASRPSIEMLLADSLSAVERLDEAEALYRALSELPKHRQAALSHIANLRKNLPDAPIFQALQDELRKGASTPEDNCNLHLAIGRIYENARDYDRAFEHFGQSKSQLKSLFDFGEFRSLVDSLIAGYQPSVLKRFEGYGDTSRLPVFVVGMPRSGTTLTEQIIAAHPKGGGVGEMRRISRMRHGLSDDKNPEHVFNRMQEGGPERCRDLASKYVSMLKFLSPDAKRVVDKMPHNFVALGFIALFFPNARIIHCVRNPADNFISAFQNWMNPYHGYSYTPEAYALYYREYLRLMRHWQSLIPERIFTLPYESLTADPETMARRLIEFVDLNWDPRCLRFHESGGMVKTFSRQQVRSPVHKGSVARWRNYERQLAPLIDILKDEPGLFD